MASSSKQKSVERVERLLASCESLVSSQREFQGKKWKLSRVIMIEIYVIALRQQLNELEKNHSVNHDMLVMFQHKVSVLENIVSDTSPVSESTSLESEVETMPVDNKPSQVMKSSSLLLSQRNAEARAELFSQSSSSSSSSESRLRHRVSSSASRYGESSEVAVERQRRNQEAIAEEMVNIARSLKDNALTAKNIIISDNQMLEKTNQQAEGNITSIDTQTGRIKEHNKGCPWGTILLLIIVFIVFLAMVILIRFVPKPSYH